MNSLFFKRLLIVLFFIQSITVFSQDSKALANAYLVKAQESFKNKDKANTEKYLNKSIQYFGEFKSKELSLLATKFYLGNKDYAKAKKYADQYFKTEKDINSKEYNEMLITFIEIEDNIDSKEVVKEKVDVKKEIKKDTSIFVAITRNQPKKRIKGKGKVGKTLRETYLLSKKYFEEKKYHFAKQNLDKFFSLEPKQDTRFYKEMQEVRSKISSEEKEVVNDEKEIEDEIIESTEKAESVITDVPFAVIEEVPIYPGCEGTRKEKSDCLAIKLKQHILRKFNVNLASDLGLSAGKKKIWIFFRIDEKGEVGNIYVRAPHPKLKEEAIRITKLLPKMLPGKQRGKPVGMKYSIPLSFNVEEDSKEEVKDN
ncbi:MAG: energy transducer TonB [Flavobacteriaceae bacterium]